MRVRRAGPELVFAVPVRSWGSPRRYLGSPCSVIFLSSPAVSGCHGGRGPQQPTPAEPSSSSRTRLNLSMCSLFIPERTYLSLSPSLPLSLSPSLPLYHSVPRARLPAMRHACSSAPHRGLHIHLRDNAPGFVTREWKYSDCVEGYCRKRCLE